MRRCLPPQPQLSLTCHRATTWCSQFQEQRCTKRYEALVLGWPQADSGVINAPIGKVRLPGEAHARMLIVEDGRASVTKWRVVTRATNEHGVHLAHVALVPLTGRAHQLRLHMAHIGHPLLGDQLHGTEAAVSAAPRLCLHAAELEYDHPATGERMTVRSDRNPFDGILEDALIRD